MRKNTFFLMASLTAFVFIITLLVRVQFWQGENGGSIPSDHPELLELVEYRWVDGAIGLIKRAHGTRCWRDLSMLHGDGVFCVIHSEERQEGSTGGYYYTLCAQLPSEPKVGDTYLLRAVGIGGNDVCEFRSMSVGETTLVEFGNPIPWLMPSVEENASIGSLKIVDVSKDTVLVEFHINATLVTWPNETSRKSFAINETVRLKREIASSALL